MLECYLPSKIYEPLKRYLDLMELNEIRLRVDCPVVVSVKNKKYYLGSQGFCDKENAIIADHAFLQEFVYKMCENSVYSVNDYLKHGYITLSNGIRVGICGEVVSENGRVVTIKNFQAVNIRIPHIVEGCSEFVLDYIIENNFLNTLILSPPGAGKTTFIRDIVYQMSKRNYSYNVLIADERNEIANINNGVRTIDLGDFADIFTNCSKEFAFKHGIRSMKPDIIVCDEIDIDNDLQALIDAVNCGVKVLATIHSDSIFQLKNKRGFENVLKNKIFDRFIVLSCKNGPGTLNSVYDSKLQCLFSN